MSPLERRCRRLLWLLPPAERAARGEELVGVLRDVSGHRSRPPAAEVISVLALALRLRLQASRTAAVIVLSALLVASATTPLGQLIDMHSGAVLARDMGPVRAGLAMDLAIAVVPLTVATAWLVGAVRTALALHSVAFLVTVVLFGAALWSVAQGPYAAENIRRLLIYMSAPVLIMLLLVAAWRLGWSPPRPRALWLLMLVLSVGAWKGVGEWGRHGVSMPAAVPRALAVAGVLVGAIAAAWLARRHRWPVIALAAATGAGAGYLIAGPAAMTNFIMFGAFDGFPHPLALLIAAAGAPAHVIVERFRPRPPAVARPARAG